MSGLSATHTLDKIGLTMSTPARVVVLPNGSNSLEVQDLIIPDPGPHQVVVKQFASGICHSQLHQMRGTERDSSLMLGHESTGVVLQIGSDVKGLSEGDIVLVTWVPKDAANTPRAPESATLETADGSLAISQAVFTWATHTIADEQYVVKVEGEIDTQVTSIIGCAVITGAGAVENTAGVKAGDSVAIFGVGGVGMSAIVAAKKLGANPIIAVDLDADKLVFARQFGATHTINGKEEDPVAAIKALTQHPGKRDFMGDDISGADFVFDCIGVKETMETIPQAARGGHFGVDNGGTAILVGVPHTSVELNAIDMLLNEKKFIGSFAGSCTPSRDFSKYVDWHRSGDLDLDALVTERYSIDDINEATTRLGNGLISGRAIIEF